ncbi:MAG: UDP-N-acetylglucosamine 2-epimerase (hydrolyzing) [Pelagibacteraceae bacterium]|nr:UDP-N-acetylglucosamine 2-epimerase (hydrolyzing) [Pelagibacteraceae bacterium]|tara:strand:- start:13568 stop:14722 length:1155 start_codon:yes stop_codon:yes gene_type:complete
MKKKICIITSSRAEYGLLSNLIKKIKNSRNLKLQLLVSGTHLSKKYGSTKKDIIRDRVRIDKEIRIVQNGDMPNNICNSFSLAIKGFSRAYQNFSPDCLVYLGDRYEILAAAYAGLIHNIPKIHIHGGELTEGVIDDATRHSITKISDFHFVSHKKYKKRIIQMGEKNENIILSGAFGIENIDKKTFLSKKKLESILKIKIKNKLLLVTLHPINLNSKITKITITNLLKALNFYRDFTIIFTFPNQDTYGEIIIKKIKNFIKDKKNFVFVKNLGSEKYLSLVKISNCVIGNSSSGIIEVPSLNVPTVNIGDRQKGRIFSKSVINCDHKTKSIKRCIERALNKNLKKIHNPYKIKSIIPSERIYKFIKTKNFKKYNLQKKFIDLI